MEFVVDCPPVIANVFSSDESVKDYPLRASDFLSSDTLYIRGVSKSVSKNDILQLLSSLSVPIAIYIEANNTHVWVKYESISITEKMIMKLHQFYWIGKYLSVKYELGFDNGGKRILGGYIHNNHPLIRHIDDSRKKDKPKSRKNDSKKNDFNVTYNNKSISVNNIDYPFPSGLYLTQIISLMSTYSSIQQQQLNPLLHIVSNQKLYSSSSVYVKEITEAMSMVNALQRAFTLLQLSPLYLQTRTIYIYVLGDGTNSLAAACVSLFHPNLNATIYSIDPILLSTNSSIQLSQDSFNNLYYTSIQDKFHIVPMKSEDFIIPHNLNAIDQLNIIVACHSHAPLDEFWARLPLVTSNCNSSPNQQTNCPNISKIAVTMNCCGTYSMLADPAPLLEYEDFECYSPKRTARVYAL